MKNTNPLKHVLKRITVILWWLEDAGAQLSDDSAHVLEHRIKHITEWTKGKKMLPITEFNDVSEDIDFEIAHVDECTVELYAAITLADTNPSVFHSAINAHLRKATNEIVALHGQRAVMVHKSRYKYVSEAAFNSVRTIAENKARAALRDGAYKKFKLTTFADRLHSVDMLINT